jgi:hypothetical protein
VGALPPHRITKKVKAGGCRDRLAVNDPRLMTAS